MAVAALIATLLGSAWGQVPPRVSAITDTGHCKLDCRMMADPPPAHVVVRRDSGGAAASVLAWVVLHDGADGGESVDTLLTAYGARTVSRLRTIPAVLVELPADRIAALAAEPAVRWMEWPLPAMAAMNADLRSSSQVDVVQQAPYGLTGAGVSIMVYDLGTVRASHVDFGGRVTIRDQVQLSVHATHVAGTIAGSGSAGGGTNRGMAPGAVIDSYHYEAQINGSIFIDNLGDMEPNYTQAVTSFPTDLANNSMGSQVCINMLDCTYAGDYGLASALIDGIVAGSLGPPYRMVWSAGNERTPDCGGRCTGVPGGHTVDGYHSVAPPAGAKNPIVVGAVYAGTEAMTPYSSWGPTDDGRIKPDLVAPGDQVGGDNGVTSCSSASDTAYAVLSGSSSSAAVVSGACALLMQDFRARYPALPDPHNATLKALFAHTTADLGRAGPDYQYGYGALRIRSAVDLMRTGALREATIDQGQTYVRMHAVSGGTSTLRVTLAWDDPPGEAEAAATLVNDLDLRAVSPLGVVHYPWTLNPSNPTAPAVRTQPDRANNIEQVLVTAPQAGTWTIEVRGFSVPQGPQAFTLVGAGASIAQIGITFPDGLPLSLSPDAPTTVHMNIAASGESVVPGSPALFYRYGGGAFASVSLVPLGGTLYRGTLPAPGCIPLPAEFYVRAQGSASGLAYAPGTAPADVFSADIGHEVIVFADDFEVDRGWTVVNDVVHLDDGGWQRGVPAGGGVRGDPPEDFDGSGQCWLTDNAAGNTDVDGGPTRLISPIIDTLGHDAQIRFAVWYTNHTGGFPGEDVLLVQASDNGGGSWTTVLTIGPQSAAGWEMRSFKVGDFFAPTGALRVRFEVSDLGGASIVEAGVDAFLVTYLDCEGGGGDGNGDFDADGDVDLSDAVRMQRCIGQPAAGACAAGDCAGGGSVNLADWSAFASLLAGPL